MTIKEKLSSEPGFQYIIDSMELMSAAGRRRMMQQEFLTDSKALQREYDDMGRIVATLGDKANSHAVATIRHQFMQMHDIQGTLAGLGNGTVLEELELFEIKSFTFLCLEAAKAAAELGIEEIVALPDTKPVFSLLDPDNTQIPNFYIYDSYHPDLAELRRQLNALQTKLDNSEGDGNVELQRRINDLFEKQNEIQRVVIAELSGRLHPYHAMLQEAFERMAYADFIFAKATLATQWALCRPEITDNPTPKASFTGLWNPRLKHRNEELGQRYQPIDIELMSGVCLVTGANMAGKTVLLKTIGIAQLLAQFGFFVPATNAAITLADDVLFCIGDEQNEMNGLSSFASEIVKISDTVSRSGKERLLILIDEPARTTNPVEGKAIVQSVASILDRRNSITIITTHYSQLGLPCRKLRVKGFVENLADIPLSPDNINRFMDYSLLPVDDDDVPQEALRIAAILGCDQKLLETARQFINTRS